MILSTGMGTYAQSDTGSHPSANKPVNYQYVFATSFPKQYQVADSIFFELAKTDTAIASRAIDDMHAAVIQTGLTQIVFLLVGLDFLVVIMAIILFPFLWKD